MTDSASTPAPELRLLALYAESSLHPGTGASLGAIDLPIQRERHTNFPVIPATSLKGSLRQSAEEWWGRANHGTGSVTVLFGPEVGSRELHAGAVSFGEARLIAYPVRSSLQVFLWVTCPLVLDRLARDAARACLPLRLPGDVPGHDAALVPKGDLSGPFVLEDLSFTPTESGEVSTLADNLAKWFLPASHGVIQKKLCRHLAIVSDENYQHLVRTTTQVTARIALNDRKTTTDDGGNLWYEETLPRDCLFSALLRFEGARSSGAGDLATPTAVAERFGQLIAERPYLQVGGNETVGQGWCALRVVEGNGQ